MNESHSNGTLPIRQSCSSLTIGYIGCHLVDKNSYSTWQGIMDAARERGVNLISFFPRDLDTTSGFDSQANVLYNLVSADRLDGLVIWTAALLSYAGTEGAKRVLDRYRPLPMVAIGGEITEDISWSGIDFYRSMREGIVHLVREHGYRRIAFIRGPDATHTGARERYQAYLDVLSEYGLPFDPDLVSPPSSGSWEQEVGEAAVSLLLDQRHVSFEALVGANDYLAIGAMQAVQRRGIHIPGQVAVIGFDDQAESNRMIPPLTTLSLQGYEWGRRATEMLLTLLEGGQIPRQVTVSPRLVIRQSCGCANPAIVQAVSAPGKTHKTSGAIQHERIVFEMQQAADAMSEGLDSKWAEQLLAAFLAELKAEPTGSFLSTLGETLQRVIAVGGQVATWTNVISALRRSILPYLGNGLMLRRAESLWLQAQVMVGETAQQTQRFQIMQAERRAQILDEIRTTLTTTLDVAALADSLAQELPRLGIPGCYLSLYQDPCQPTKTSRLVLAYDERRGRLEPTAGQQVFPSQLLTPKGILSQDRDDQAASPHSFVVEALYFQKEQLGFVLFEVGPREGPIYETLQGEISSALQGTLLMQRVQERSAELARQQYILDTFMENVPDSIYFKDLDSRITRANRSHAFRLGLTDPAEEIGKSDFDFFLKEQAQIKYEQEQEIIRSGQPLLNLEEPDGMGRWALTTKMPLRNESGDIIGTFGISRNITALKETQAALERAYREVEQQVQERTAQLQQEIIERKRAEAEREALIESLEAKNAELERFTYTVSHDLKSPLITIRGFLGYIEQDARSGDLNRLKADMQRITAATDRMQRLLNDLLELSRIGRLMNPPQNIALDSLVRDILKPMEDRLQERNVKVQIQENLPVVFGDAQRLSEVIQNLLDNAIKFMGEQPQPLIEIGTAGEERGLPICYVRDNGMGIAPEYHERIFGLFNKLDPKVEGTGVGLAIVKRIVEVHGGRIWVESEEGKGATFYFTLGKGI